MSAASYAGAGGNGGPPVRVVVILSVLFHLAVIVGIPLMLKLTERNVSFDRPPTFQLVTAPPSAQPVAPNAEPVKKLSKPEPVRKKSTVKKSGTKPVPKDRSKPEKKEDAKEDVEELASVLNELPAPATVTTVGEFKYNWYLENMTRKISRFWSPSTENRSVSVVVSFCVYSDGSISEPRIATSSGSGSLDNLALRAVQLAAPFGQLPPGFSGHKLELTCTLIPTRN